MSADQRTQNLEQAKSFYDRLGQAIVEIDLDAAGVSSEEFQLETSQYLFDLFAVLSSIDHPADQEEIELYTYVLGFPYEDYSESFAYAADLQEDFVRQIPPFLNLAVLQDQRTGGDLGATIVDCLIGIARIIIETDQQTLIAERRALKAYSTNLESFLSEMGDELPAARPRPRRNTRVVKRATPKPSAAPPESASDGTGNRLDTLLKELSDLVGLYLVKREVLSLINLLRIQSLRESHGLNSPIVSLHMVFSGNPGTGKTTVARLLAQIYAEIGVLRSGQLVEVDRSGLVSGYVGQTALNVQEVVTSALGGVLFIDEAYSLARTESENDFGAEAIETLLKLMEDHRGDLVVIVAGYTAEMRLFLNSNPGIRSRFNKFIEFPDYSVEELAQIFDYICVQSSYTLNDAGKQELHSILERVTARRDPGFGNARAVRNYFEQAIAHHANRMAAKTAPTMEELTTLTEEDLQLVVA